MARSEARIFTSIWKDKDFLRLPQTAQWLYLFLVSQPDLTHCGVIPLRVRRWARNIDGLTHDQIHRDLDVLSRARFVVIDQDTEELLIRTLMRRDKVLRQPFLFVPAAEAIDNVESLPIQAALLEELQRLVKDGDVNEKVLPQAKTLINSLAMRQEMPGDTLSVSLSDTHPDTLSESQPGSLSDRHTGEGGSYGEVVEPSPFPVPPPPPPVPATVPAAATTAASGSEGEEDSQEPPDQRLADLVAEVKVIRPEWSERSIRRALTRESVVERPLEIVRHAALAVARDPTSQAPGRLEHDGPWWRTPAPPQQPRPASETCPAHLLELPCRGCAADQKASR
jgi:hypothetical protein